MKISQQTVNGETYWNPRLSWKVGTCEELTRRLLDMPQERGALTRLFFNALEAYDENVDAKTARSWFGEIFTEIQNNQELLQEALTLLKSGNVSIEKAQALETEIEENLSGLAALKGKFGNLAFTGEDN